MDMQWYSLMIEVPLPPGQRVLLPGRYGGPSLGDCILSLGRVVRVVGSFIHVTLTGAPPANLRTAEK